MTGSASAQCAGEVALSWTAPTENTDSTQLTDLAGFVLYWTDTPPSFDNALELADPDLRNYIVSGLCPAEWHFTMAVRNSAGVESALSKTVTKIVTGTGPALPGPVQNLEVEWREAQSIYSLAETDFDGMSHVDAGSFNLAPDAMAIDFVITPRSYVSPDARIISKATGTSEQSHEFMVSHTTGGVLRFRLKAGGFTTTLIGQTPIPLNVETRGQVDYDGTTMRILVEGQVDASTPKSGSIAQSSAPVWIGANPPDGAQPYDGSIAVTVR